MDIDLRLPSGEQCKEDDEANGIDDILDNGHRLHNGDVDVGKTEVVRPEECVSVVVPAAELVDFKEDMNLEPLAGMEFESHGAAYSFYQEYARSMGFNTAIQNSRRSKTTREFIDAKFACSRYGTKREYDKQLNRPRARQNILDPENTTGRRACAKTDCKASMHVKKRPDGKWIIHSFVKEHNHELLPAQAVSEQTRKMYAAMARQFAEYKNVIGLKHDPRNPFEKGRNSVLETADIKNLLDFFMEMQNTNSNFFYAIDVGEDQRVKSLFWVDAKSRHDYSNFCDVVSFDTTYVRSKYKIPLALFVGVNQHYQFILLGCALISDESAATFSWAVQTWLKAMDGQAPRVMVTDQDKVLNSVVSEVLPNVRHCFFLWSVLGKVSENLGHVMKQHGNIMAEFEKCIYMSWKEEDFCTRWWEMLDGFGLKEDAWMKSLYEDRRKWAPTYMTDVLLAGMSTSQRSDSVNSFFDKFVHKKTNAQEFVKQYESILQDRYEEEAKADSDTWNKQPTMKSPSPFEKSVSGVYTHAVFRKFQAEVLGAIACSPKQESQDGANFIYRVRDFEKNQDFVVIWNQTKEEISCICRLFEYKGYLCRHTLNVLQCCHLSTIPTQYILKRWTREAKNREGSGEPGQMQTRLQRYNDLYQRAIKLSEESSLSQESYIIAFRALEEALDNCIGANTAGKTMVDVLPSPSQGLISMVEDNQSRGTGKANKKKNPLKKRKMNSEQDVVTVAAQDSIQQMEKLSPRAVTLDSYYGAQQGVQGMVQLNLMAPTRDNFYANQQTIQGLGQLNTIGPSHDGYYSAQQGIHGLGQMDFFRPPAGFHYGIREDPNVRAQLQDDASRHA